VSVMRTAANSLAIAAATLAALALVDARYIGLAVLLALAIALAVLSRRFPAPGSENADLD
jgi:hypothetical protein